ncbi:P-loop containing nucleoside triphosphate hydrolase protein [Phycomyces nitens]|nr:P-loop containing nucleoside triphosphate hydrolase protein [Phycomyces nitens]
MPSSAVARRSLNMHQIKCVFDKILTLLERISEETFWEGLIGPRLANLGKRYFGNDFVMLSVIFYITPILRTRWDELVERLLRNRNDPKYVSVEIRPSDNIYSAIAYFINRNTKSVPGLKEAVAGYEPEEVQTSDSPVVKTLPKVGFYPLVNTSAEIEYKGHILHVARRTDDDSSTSHHRSRTEYISISMEDEDLNLLKQFMQEWADQYNEQDGDNVTIYKYNGYSWECMKTIEPRGFETVNLKPGLKEKVVNDMEIFRHRRKWYKTRGIPYRRGYLLYGPPGTGKTSLIQALASKLGMNVAVVSLLEVHGDSEFTDMLADAPSNSLLVIEDLDHYMGSTEGGRLTMSGMLNALDGIQGQEGAMIFMTCNDFNKIQPALLRPGRMDVKLKLDYAVREQVVDMFWRFFGHDYDTFDMIVGKRRDYLATICDNFADSIPADEVTTAELQSYFITLIMESSSDENPDSIFTDLITGIPDFLSKIKVDREQAAEHARMKLNSTASTVVEEETSATEAEEESTEAEEEEKTKEEEKKINDEEKTKDEEKKVKSKEKTKDEEKKVKSKEKTKEEEKIAFAKKIESVLDDVVKEVEAVKVA